MTPSIMWLLAGALFLALEAFGAPGIGFLFIGLGAILTGLLIELDILSSTDLVLQFAALFINSSMLAVLLWRKVKQFRGTHSKQGHYSNMVGDEAVVTKPITASAAGEARWSGTLMRAELAEGQEPLIEGTRVTITAVNGNTLIVAAK